MKWKQQIHGMKAYQPGKPMEEVKKMFGLDEVVKLASNENPFGSSPKVKEFLQQDETNCKRLFSKRIKKLQKIFKKLCKQFT